MLRYRKKITCFLIMLALLLTGVWGAAEGSLAADVSVIIQLSSPNVKMGDAVSATVVVSGDAISSFTMDVSYTSSVLEFTGASGMANGGGGNVRISFTGSGSVTLNFKAIANGTATISTSGNECYDIQLNQLSVSHAGASVTVSTPEEPTSEPDKPTEDDPNNENTEEETDDRSKNFYLASLSVSPGNLSPAFSRDNTNYYVELEEDAASILVSATPEDDKAQTSVSGANSLVPGANTVRITVTAENGAVRVYTITVQCGEEENPLQVEIDGITWSIETDLDIEAPDGFVDGKTTYNEEEVDCLVSGNGRIVILPLSNLEEIRWFIYDEEKGTFVPYVEYSAQFARFILMDLPEGVEVPFGFRPADITIAGNSVKAYTDGSENGFYLVYAINLDSENEDAEGFYLYDSLQNTYMRFPGVPAAEEETPVIEEPSTQEATKGEAPAEIRTEPEKKKDESVFTRGFMKFLIALLAALLVIMAIALIVMIVRLNKLRNRLDDSGEEEYDDDEPLAENEKIAEEQPEEMDAAPAGGVTGDTAEILLETAEDNNSSVQVERPEEVEDRIREAMKERPYGIDSAFDVVAEEPTAKPEQVIQETVEKAEVPKNETEKPHQKVVLPGDYEEEE